MNQEEITKHRNKYIRQFIKKSEGVRKGLMKYKGPVERDSLTEDALRYYNSQLKGDEIVVEYHMFEIQGSLPMVMQWRLRDPK